MAVRAITMLPCITGAWKHAGGGIQLSTSGAFGLNKLALEMPELMLKSPLRRAARIVNMSTLGEALTQLQDPPVKAVFVYNSNPAAVAPNHNAVVRGFLRSDLFTVVHEQFFTDTTNFADILLPATTFFEHKDIQTAYGHYYLQVSNPAIAAPGECRSNVQVFSELAQRMGFEEPCFQETADELIDRALESDDPWLKGLTRDRLERGPVRLNFESGSKADKAKAGNGIVSQPNTASVPKNGHRPFLPFAEGGFPTHNGRALLYNEALIELGLDAVASFVPPEESRHSQAAREYPLELLSRKADNFLNSTFVNLPSHQPLEPLMGVLEMSDVDAELRGVHDGDPVRVFNARGEIRLQAKVGSAVQVGVVATRLGWPKLSAMGIGVNALTSEKLTDIGRGATFYSCLVEVEALRGTATG